MVQFINRPESQKSRLAGMIGKSLGQGLGTFVQDYSANKDIEKMESNPEFKKKPLSEKFEDIQRVVGRHGEAGQRILQTKMQVAQMEKQEAEEKLQKRKGIAFRKRLSDQELTEDEKELFSPEEELAIAKHKQQIELQQLKNDAKGTAPEQQKQVYNDLLASGMPENEARVYINAPASVQNRLMQEHNELISRGKRKPISENESPKENVPSIQQSGEGKQIQSQYEYPEIPPSKNLTDAESAKQQMKREEFSLPLYIDVSDKIDGLDEQLLDIQRLQQLDEGEGIPSGLEKWNVDWNTGEPRVLSQLPPQAQLYIKTIANMLGKAKDFFPGRVTNFDLETFKRRFPSLANSKEGRQLVAKQLEIANRIAFLREETIKNAYDHYGIDANPQFVRKVAKQNYDKLKKELEGRLKSLDGLLESEYEKNQQTVPEGDVKVRSPDGQTGSMPRQMYEEALRDGVKYELAE